MKTNQCDQNRIDTFLQGESVWIESDLAEHLETCHECRDYMLAQTAAPEQWKEARDLLRRLLARQDEAEEGHAGDDEGDGGRGHGRLVDRVPQAAEG